MRASCSSPIAATAETNRSPFDLPEGESELVAGYFTEYSGFKFALFFLGEYVGMMGISGLGTTLFLGGYSAPLQVLGFVPSWAWFIGKVMLSMCVFIWIRGTLPRLRQDQLMNFAWKFVLPLTLLNLFVAGLWRFMGEGFLRWVCLLRHFVGGVCGDGARGHETRALWAEELPLCRLSNCGAAEARFPLAASSCFPTHPR